MFPYDPQHQTFLNVYEDDRLTQQEIFTQERQTFVYRTGAGQSRLSLVREFTKAGILHIFTGPDHILFMGRSSGLPIVGFSRP